MDLSELELVHGAVGPSWVLKRLPTHVAERFYDEQLKLLIHFLQRKHPNKTTVATLDSLLSFRLNLTKLCGCYVDVEWFLQIWRCAAIGKPSKGGKPSVKIRTSSTSRVAHKISWKTTSFLSLPEGQYRRWSFLVKSRASFGRFNLAQFFYGSGVRRNLGEAALHGAGDQKKVDFHAGMVNQIEKLLDCFGFGKLIVWQSAAVSGGFTHPVELLDLCSTLVSCSKIRTNSGRMWLWQKWCTSVGRHRTSWSSTKLFGGVMGCVLQDQNRMMHHLTSSEFGIFFFGRSTFTAHLFRPTWFVLLMKYCEPRLTMVQFSLGQIKEMKVLNSGRDTEGYEHDANLGDPFNQIPTICIKTMVKLNSLSC